MQTYSHLKWISSTRCKFSSCLLLNRRAFSYKDLLKVCGQCLKLKCCFHQNFIIKCKVELQYCVSPWVCEVFCLISFHLCSRLVTVLNVFSAVFILKFGYLCPNHWHVLGRNKNLPRFKRDTNILTLFSRITPL